MKIHMMVLQWISTSTFNILRAFHIYYPRGMHLPGIPAHKWGREGGGGPDIMEKCLCNGMIFFFFFF